MSVVGVGSAGSSKKLKIIICLDASFITPTQLPLEREEQEVDSVTVESRERHRDGEPQQPVRLPSFTAL